MAETNSWELYSKNKQAWQAMLDDCASAKESIVLEQFIFVKDEFGQKLLDICKKRAKDGVKIRFLWDAAGSFTFRGSNIVEELKNSGIELLFWRTLIPDFFKVPNFRFWYFRNHRRTLVIDGKVGYTGSICVDDNFKNWRDTNVRMEGPVVREMKEAFEDMWSRASERNKSSHQRTTSRSDFRYVTNYPAPGRRHIYTEVIEALRKAKKHIYITTPYFVPTHRLLRALKSARRKGVDVKIILPERSDHYLVDLGARSYFSTLLHSGIRVFLYTGNMIHSKSITIDDTWSTVGTMNLDSISLLYNFEANIVTTNDDFSKELKEHFLNDIKETREIDKKQWQNRSFIKKVLEISVRLIKKFL